MKFPFINLLEFIRGKDEYGNEPESTPSRMPINLGSVTLRFIENINDFFITDEHLRRQ